MVFFFNNKNIFKKKRKERRKVSRESHALNLLYLSPPEPERLVLHPLLPACPHLLPVFPGIVLPFPTASGEPRPAHSSRSALLRPLLWVLFCLRQAELCITCLPPRPPLGGRLSVVPAQAPCPGPQPLQLLLPGTPRSVPPLPPPTAAPSIVLPGCCTSAPLTPGSPAAALSIAGDSGTQEAMPARTAMCCFCPRLPAGVPPPPID